MKATYVSYYVKNEIYADSTWLFFNKMNYIILKHAFVWYMFNSIRNLSQ